MMWSASWTGWLLLRAWGRGVVILLIVAWLVVLGLHATPAQAPRLIMAIERAWEHGLLGAGGWRAAWDERGEQYYIRPGGGARLRARICLPDRTAGLAWAWAEGTWRVAVGSGQWLWDVDARPVQVTQRGACDVEAWWAVARPGWVL